MEEKIDFVITWVDENDPKWRKEFEYYSAKEGKTVDNSTCRYRNWDTLQYWFRGVERFAPWVNKIFFVSWGHFPDWLNLDNPKLVIVKHEDFIPAQYLPTFSSDVFEFYFHKIEGLSNRFVYFNDDMFLINDVTPNRFFRDGLPCDIGAMSLIGHWTMFGSAEFLAVAMINQSFNKKEVIKKDLSKWFNLTCPRCSARNLLYYRQAKFPGFLMNHLPQGYLKETYDEVWKNCKDDLLRTSANKFRTYGDTAPWLLRYWQLASGKFIPYNIFKDGKYYPIKDDNVQEIAECIRLQKKKLICINDNPKAVDFEKDSKIILEAFDKLLPQKCSFER